MTSKVYRSAQGKSVDLGTIMLQNEHVRAVGNMKVNARGDKIDSMDNVIETKTQQIQRQNERTSTNVSSQPPQTSARKKSQAPKKKVDPTTQVHSHGHVQHTSAPEPVVETVAPAPVAESPAPRPQVVQRQQPAPMPAPQTAPESRAPAVDLRNPARPPKSPAADNQSTQAGGLASAIARSREIKQDLERTRRQKAQDSGVRKI